MKKKNQMLKCNIVEAKGELGWKMWHYAYLYAPR